MILLLGCAVTAACAPAPVTDPGTSTNPGLVEALDAIVREACEYWTDQQYARMHEMLVEHAGGAKLRKLSDEEREALLASFRGRVERLWRLETGSLEFKAALAGLAWRLDSMFEREPPDEEALKRIREQASQLVAEVAELPRKWAGGPYKHFLDEVVKETQVSVGRTLRDPLSLGFARLLTGEETDSIKEHLAVRWNEQQRLLENRLEWIEGQDNPNRKSLQTIACENALRSYVAEVQAYTRSRTLPPSPTAVQDLGRELAAERREAAKRRFDQERKLDPVEQFQREHSRQFRPVVEQAELAVTALDLAALLRYLAGGEAIFVP